MVERPIIFTPPLISAIADGQKTQTRRLINPQPIGSAPALARCKFGAVGDRLWVRPNFFTSRGESDLLLEITSLGTQRLREISAQDAIAEGCDSADPLRSFRELWDRIASKPGTTWRDNPWVWVICFRRL